MPKHDDRRGQPLSYTTSPQVAWTVQPKGIRIIDEVTRAGFDLGYPAAAVWDLLQRSYPAAQLVVMVAALARVGQAEAEGLVRESVAAWVRSGWLVAR